MDDSGDKIVSLCGAPGRGVMPDWYGELLESVSGRISAGRVRAVLAANTEAIMTYWAIGQDVLERQELEGWGAKVIDRLSADLRERHPGLKGFSARNLQYMRTFAATWPAAAIAQQPAAQLPWGHHQLLLDRLRAAPDARLWYAEQSLSNGWSRNILDLQIDRQLYERTGKAVTNFATTLPDADSDLAQQATRDPHLLDFFGPSTGMRERQVDQALIAHVERFLLELGQGFAFVGRQQRLTVGRQDFYLDLLFFHIELNCYVVIELKAVPFEAGFIGQVGMYMAAIDDQVRKPAHGPTIGLVLCKTKDAQVAQYAVDNSKRPIGVADWADALQSSLPPDLAEELPSIEELEAELAAAGTSLVSHGEIKAEADSHMVERDRARRACTIMQRSVAQSNHGPETHQQRSL